MAEHTFPDDLRDLQRQVDQIRAGRAALLARLPHRAVEMPEPYSDGRGAEHPAHRGWTDDEHAQVNAP